MPESDWNIAAEGGLTVTSLQSFLYRLVHVERWSLSMKKLA